MYSKKRQFGNYGEYLAVKFLSNNGHEILCRNYLKNTGEIDIVTINREIIHFIEVKSVSRETEINVSHETINDNYRPEDNLHDFKIHRLIKTAQIFIEEYGFHNYDFQFDLITIIVLNNGKMVKIDCLENINID